MFGVTVNEFEISRLDTKNDDRRGMPLHPRALAALANLPHRAGKVFRRPDKQLYEPKDGEGGQIKTAFKGACRRAGIADRHDRPHNVGDSDRRTPFEREIWDLPHRLEGGSAVRLRKRFRQYRDSGKDGGSPGHLFGVVPGEAGRHFRRPAQDLLAASRVPARFGKRHRAVREAPTVTKKRKALSARLLVGTAW